MVGPILLYIDVYSNAYNLLPLGNVLELGFRRCVRCIGIVIWHQNANRGMLQLGVIPRSLTLLTGKGYGGK